jgi:hypothetical protein
MKQEIQNLQEAWQKNVSRKGYLEGTRGWENFLLFDAPGVPHTSERTTPESMVQVLSPVASRIVGDYEREEREIVRFVQEVCHIFSYFGSGPTDPADDVKESCSTRSASTNDNND